MAKGCCGGNGDAVLAAKARLGVDSPAMLALAIQSTEPTPSTSETKLRFTGTTFGAITFYGLNGREYRAGANPIDRYVLAHNDDVQKLLATGMFETVAPPPVVAPPAEPMVFPVSLADQTADGLQVEEVPTLVSAALVAEVDPLPAPTAEASAPTPAPAPVKTKSTRSRK